MGHERRGFGDAVRSESQSVERRDTGLELLAQLRRHPGQTIDSQQLARGDIEPIEGARESESWTLIDQVGQPCFGEMAIDDRGLRVQIQQVPESGQEWHEGR